MIRKQARKAVAAKKATPARKAAMEPQVVKMSFGKILMKPGIRFWPWLVFPNWFPRVVFIHDRKVDPLVFEHLRAGQRIAWFNANRQGYSVHFDPANWPFSDAPQDIPVNPGQFSHVFTIKPTGQTAPKPFKYVIFNLGWPPGEPEIVVDP
jgi:hypothetical protein